MFDYNNKTNSGEMVCDYCATVESFEGSFIQCIEQSQDNDWIIKKAQDAWMHFCSKECLARSKEKGWIE